MNLKEKLKTLPVCPGVYFHKDKTGEIIYIGKASVLKNRVRQYFQNSRYHDDKTKALVAEIKDTDWVETDSEIDALFLEAEMVRRYMPRYNILLRDDKSMLYVRIDMKSQWPHVDFTRNPLDDDAQYFGPYVNGFAVKKALRILRTIFPYFTKAPNNNQRPDLDVHIGLSPSGTSSDEYKRNLRQLVSYIKGNRKKIIADLEIEMKKAAKKQEFEKAATIRNQVFHLKELRKSIVFGDKEFLDISKDQALNDLTEMLGLKKIPVRIEGYDISHISGSNVVASMVVFKNGTSDRALYRKFKLRIDRNDDFKNMKEVISRRLSEKNLKSWGKPDLILIDGGKGQLDAALQARNALNQETIPFIGLAKRDEQIVISQRNSRIELNVEKLGTMKGFIDPSENYITINLDKKSHIIRLLQRIRDESHRFAVSYHTSLKRAGQTQSILDDIPGIGPKTRARLIKEFGSVKSICLADEQKIANVIGKKKASQLKSAL